MKIGLFSNLLVAGENMRRTLPEQIQTLII
ncbi:UNVERIFIED_CONTAM: hypothetical protein GTU68_006974 [Idotea baltica]|nr:hypothetical protein [Idotea baltica]